VHHDPDRALSDGMQSIYPEQFEELMTEIRQMAGILHRGVPTAANSAQTAAVR